MIVKQKKSKNNNGEFIINRHDTAQNFVCDRCLRPKTAKIVVEWKNESGNKNICNGCYGMLSAE